MGIFSNKQATEGEMKQMFGDAMKTAAELQAIRDASVDTPRCNALEGDPLDSFDCRAWMTLARELERELYTRPRTEFVAVGWWTGSSLEWEPSLTPVRGMLLFRPVPDKRTDAAGDRHSQESK